MFPSSSSTNNYQLPFPCDTNQTQLLEKSFTNVIDYQNPKSISHGHHFHQYYSQYSDGQQAPNFLEHDGLLLSYLLSHQQLLLGNSSTANANFATSHHVLAHESAEISVVGSNSIKAVELNHADIDHEKETIIPAAASKGSSSSKFKKNNMKMNGEGGGEKKAKVPRKRSSGKTDRHSKICTAQGPRDRRMRLSLQIARKFFDLQDMLGFDKASKTIEWLFTKSKTSIKELKQGLLISPVADYSSTNGATAKMNSSTNSECATSEVASKLMEISSTGTVANADFSVGMTREKKNRKLCVVAKESRAEARARARERTRVKMMRSRGRFDADHHQNSTKQSPDHQVLLNPNDDLGGHVEHLWTSNCPDDQLFETVGLINSMMMGINPDQKIVGRTDSSGAPRSSLNFGYTLSGHGSVDPSGANSEDCDFPGFPGNWGGINNTKNIKGNVLQIDQNPTRSNYGHSYLLPPRTET